MPPAVITTINGYTKVFLGLLIERALEVQRQYAGRLPTPPPDRSGILEDNPNLPLEMSLGLGEPSSFDSGLLSPSTLQPSFSTQESHSNTQSFTDQHREEPLGPLLPDHLREAFRRYKRDGEAGGIGLEGLSLGFGMKGTGSARSDGKRLFM